MPFDPGTDPFRLRFSVSSEGEDNSVAGNYEIYVSKNGGAYAPVTISSTMGVKSTDAGSSADETAITVQRLSSPTAAVPIAVVPASANQMLSTSVPGVLISPNLLPLLDTWTLEFVSRSGTGPWSFAEDSYNNQHKSDVAITALTAGTYLMQVDYKGIGPTPRNIGFSIWNTDNWTDYAGADYATDGSVVNAAYRNGVISSSSSTITALGGGQYRINIRFTVDSVLTATGVYTNLLSGSSSTYTGLSDGSGIQLNNARLTKET